jgi:hypothetical protein
MRAPGGEKSSKPSAVEKKTKASVDGGKEDQNSGGKSSSARHDQEVHDRHWSCHDVFGFLKDDFTPTACSTPPAGLREGSLRVHHGQKDPAEMGSSEPA